MWNGSEVIQNPPLLFDDSVVVMGGSSSLDNGGAAPMTNDEVHFEDTRVPMKGHTLRTGPLYASGVHEGTVVVGVGVVLLLC